MAVLVVRALLFWVCITDPFFGILKSEVPDEMGFGLV